MMEREEHDLADAEKAASMAGTPPDPLGLGKAKASIAAKIPNPTPEAIIRTLHTDSIDYDAARRWVEDLRRWRGEVAAGAEVVEASLVAALRDVPQLGMRDAAIVAGAPDAEDVVFRIRQQAAIRGKMIRYSIGEARPPADDDGNPLVNHAAFAAHDRNELASLRLEADIAGAVHTTNAPAIAICVVPYMPNGAVPAPSRTFVLHREGDDIQASG